MVLLTPTGLAATSLRYSLALSRKNNLFKYRTCSLRALCSSSIASYPSPHSKKPQNHCGVTLSSQRNIFSYPLSQENGFSPILLDGMSVEMKEAWLESMLQSQHVLDAEPFLIVLRAMPQSGSHDSARRAEQWITRLENHPVARPTAECYQRVIEAWASSTSENPTIAIARAERWLMKHQNSDIECLRPTTASFNAFLDICSKGYGLKGSKKDTVRQHAEKVQSYVKYMIEQRANQGPNCRASPDEESFNFLIRAWTRCRQSRDIVDRAMDALHLFEDYQRDVDPQVRPNTKTYAMVMDAITVSARLKVQVNKQYPRKHSDKSLNGLDEIDLLMGIVDFMQKNADNGHIRLAPNTYIYNILISCWAHISALHAHGPLKAEKLLQKMIAMKDSGREEVAPDAFTYMSVIRAWINSKAPIRAKRAEWWLKQQWENYRFEENDNLKPKATTYNLVLRGWASVGDPLRVETIFKKLMEDSRADATGSLALNSESYSYLIRSWISLAEKGNVDAIGTALEWLEELVQQEKEETGLLTSIDLYCGVITAARKCATRDPRCLKFAIKAFNMLRNSRFEIACHHYTRVLQIGILSFSKPENNEERRDFINKIITDCTEDGLLSSLFLQTLADGPVFYDGWTIEESSRTVKEHFSCWPLPLEWTRNLRQDALKPRRSDLNRSKFEAFPHGRNPYE